MNGTKIMLNIALWSSIVSSSYFYAAEPQQPDKVQQFLKQPFVRYSLAGIATALAASAFTLYYREPKPDAKPRYKLNKVIDLKLLTSNPREYLKNWQYIIYDGWIGQGMKDSMMTWKDDGGERYIKQSRKCLPFGVCGNVAALLVVLGKSQKLMKGLAAVGTAGTGIFVAHNPDFIYSLATGKKTGKSEDKKPSFSLKDQWDIKVQCGQDPTQAALELGFDPQPQNP